MALSEEQIISIETTIQNSFINKLKKYKPETEHRPSHHRLLGKDRMASFIHSLNTTFGTSLFEPVAEILAKPRVQYVRKQYQLGNTISEYAQSEIQDSMNSLTMKRNPNKKEKTERIRKTPQTEPMKSLKTVKVDL